jgi:hypothetical protein
MTNYIDYINTIEDKKPKTEVYENLYLGNHYKVFQINQYEYFTDINQYLVYNFFEILTNTINDLLWNEPPKVKFKNQAITDAFNQFKFQSDLFVKLREATITSSYAGDCVLRLSNNKIEQIDNDIWYPIYNPNSPRSEATGHILKYEKEIEKTVKAYLLEIHIVGQIEYQAYRETNNKYTQVSPMIDWSDELKDVLIDSQAIKSGKFIYKTNCNYPLVFVIKNNPNSKSHYGQSDYTLPLISKVFNINALLNQAQSVLRRHANPKMIVPKGVIKQAINEVTQDNTKAVEFGFQDAQLAMKQYHNDKTLLETIVASKIINKLEFFGSDINSSEPKYLTWDGNLDASEKQVKTLINACFDEAQLAKILIDPTINSGNLSGVAIQRLSQASLNKASKKEAYITSTLAKILYSWCQLSGYEPEYPSIQFSDGLVNDLKETIENQELLLNNQLTTRLDAIVATRDMTPEQAQEVINKIDNVL